MKQLSIACTSLAVLCMFPAANVSAAPESLEAQAFEAQISAQVPVAESDGVSLPIFIETPLPVVVETPLIETSLPAVVETPLPIVPETVVLGTPGLNLNEASFLFVDAPSVSPRAQTRLVLSRRFPDYDVRITRSGEDFFMSVFNRRTSHQELTNAPVLSNGLGTGLSAIGRRLFRAQQGNVTYTLFENRLGSTDQISFETRTVL